MVRANDDDSILNPLSLLKPPDLSLPTGYSMLLLVQLDQWEQGLGLGNDGL